MRKSNKEKIDVERTTVESHEEKGNVKIIGIVIASLIVLLVLFLIILKFNLMISEQLRIVVTPEYSELSVNSPGNISLSVGVSLYNKFFCSSTCTYELRDLSHDTLLESGSFNSRTYAIKEHSFFVQLKDDGFGKNIYTYDITCVNVPKTLCPSENDSLMRRSIFIVSYSPPKEQLDALEYNKQAYTLISQNLINASQLLMTEEKIISTNTVSDTKIFFNTTIYYNLKYRLDAFNTYVINLIDLWNKNNYIGAKGIIIEKDLSSQSQKLRDGASQYYLQLLTTITNHNSLILEIQNLNPTLSAYSNIWNKLLSKDLFNSKNSTLISTRQSIMRGNILITSLNSPIHDYDVMYNDLAFLKKAMDDNNPNLVNDTLHVISTNQPSLYVYTQLLCLVNRVNSTAVNTATLDCANYLSSGKIMKNIPAIISFNDSIVEASLLLDKTCDQSLAISDDIVRWQDDEDNISESNDSLEALLFMYSSLKEYESLYGVSAVSIYYSNYIHNILVQTHNVSDPDAVIIGKSFNNTLIELDKNNMIFKNILSFKNSCYGVSSNTASNNSNVISIIPLTAKMYNLSMVMASELGENAIALPAIPEIISSCCVYNNCQSCEKTSSKNPVVLLHGHSFNQKTNVYSSIEIFNNFEQAFIQDELYYPTGLLVKTDNSTAGILGHYSISTISKSTYYLDTYNDLLGLKVSESKTGNVDTYALRLKESIDYTKYITGSDKVDIVAHSMGGLVVRRYMQVFGTKDLGTIILVATPNSGISEKTYSLCKIFGAINECDDMRAEGLFIKKLNDYTSQIDTSNLYLVIGKGCDMDSLDGDGVVSVNSSLLRNVAKNHILYVEGMCSGTTMLHNELLDTNKYPEVYDFVKRKLNN